MRMAEVPRWAKTAGRFRGWTGRDIHELVRLFTMSAADFLDEWFDDDRVKGALATQAIIGAWCGPMTPGSAYVLMHHWIGEVDGHFGAWGWVKGGMGGVSQAMARAAEAAGATIRTDAPVARVAVNSQGRAVGVELEDGSLIRAKAVVSNAHPKTTYLDLVGEEQLPDDVVRDIRRYRSRSGSVKINIAPGGAPRRIRRGTRTATCIAGSRRSRRPWSTWSERSTTRSTAGASEHPYAEVMFPTAHEPGLAPEGKHIMMAFTQYGPIELREGSWETEREAYAQRVIDGRSRATRPTCPARSSTSRC